MVLLSIILEISCIKCILTYDWNKFIIIVKGITCCCIFLKLHPYCEILIYRHVCLLAPQFWIVSIYSSQEPTGWGSAAQTFNGKFITAGLQIPTTCLYGGSEGSPYILTQFLSNSTVTLLIRYGVNINHIENQIVQEWTHHKLVLHIHLLTCLNCTITINKAWITWALAWKNSNLK